MFGVVLAIENVSFLGNEECVLKSTSMFLHWQEATSSGRMLYHLMNLCDSACNGQDKVFYNLLNLNLPPAVTKKGTIY